MSDLGKYGERCIEKGRLIYYSDGYCTHKQLAKTNKHRKSTEKAIEQDLEKDIDKSQLQALGGL